MEKEKLFKQILSILLGCSILVSGCSKKNKSNNQTSEDRISCEESTHIALSLLEYDLGAQGYLSSEAFASNGETDFAGIVYSDFTEYAVDEEGTCYFYGGFLQTISKSSTYPVLMTPELVKDENHPFIAVDGDNNHFLINEVLPSVESFSFVIDNWYNIIKRVGDFVVEINTYENNQIYYDYDISCFSYDTNKWIFKSDQDLIAFNIEAVGLYSDYSKVYIQTVKMIKELIALQENNSFNYQASTTVVISGEILKDSAFAEQQGMINGVYLTDLLAAQSQLRSNQYLSITPDGVSVYTDETELQAKKRVEKGIIALIANSLLIAGEVVVIVATWGTTGVPMGFAIAATVTASCALAYATFNIGEAISDIAYGSQGDIESKSINYLKDGFQLIFGEDGGTIAYNVWGISNAIISSLIMPIGTIITGGVEMGMTATQIVGSVAQYIGVKVLEAAAVAITSRLIGLAAGEFTYQLTGDEVAKLYATDLTTIAAAIGIGIGVSALDKRFDFSGLKKFQYAVKLKQVLNERYKEVHKSLTAARNQAGKTLKELAVEDIMNGGDSRAYGLDPSNPDDFKIIEFVQTNGRFPSYAAGDGFQCEFAHGIDVSAIEKAVLNGQITLEQGVAYASNTNNGMLTSHSNHFVNLHNGNWTNATDWQQIVASRPSTQDTIMSIMQAMGLA